MDERKQKLTLFIFILGGEDRYIVFIVNKILGCFINV